MTSLRTYSSELRHGRTRSSNDSCGIGINQVAAPLIDSDFLKKGDGVTLGDALCIISPTRARECPYMENRVTLRHRVTLRVRPQQTNPRGDDVACNSTAEMRPTLRGTEP